MISIGLLTYNVYRTGREQMFRQTVASIDAGAGGEDYTLNIVSNGSNDGTGEMVQRLGGYAYDAPSQMWHGMQTAIEIAASHNPEIIVFSADDVKYNPDWMPKLRNFWEAAPANLVLVSLFIEPEWPWNEPLGAFSYGGVKGIYRESAPGCCWSFRAADIDLILPIPQESPREDLITCERLRRREYDIGQIDLAEHIGERQSAWGNQSWRTAKPLDRKKWGLDE
jgi:hypothetical protein